MSKEKEIKKEKDVLKEEAITSPSKAIIKSFFSNKLGMVGTIGFLLIVLAVFIGSALMPYDAYYSQGIMKNKAPGSGYMNVPNELKSEGVKDISVGTTFAVGLSNQGKFYVWGHEPAKKVAIPKEALDAQGNIEQVAAGDNHILVLTKDNKIIGWGENNHKQATLPFDVEKLIKDEGIAKIGANDLYSVILTKEGTIKVWGATMPTGLNSIPAKLNKKVQDFEVASTNILVLTKDGTVEVIGTKGTEIDTAKPKEISDGSKKIVEIGRMRSSGVAITDSGEMIVWGSKAEGAYNVPKEIDGKVVKAVSGREHITVLTDKGKLYSWGKDNYGATKVPTDDGYVNLFSGYFNNYAVKEDGSVTTWGLDGFKMGSDEQGRDLFVRLVHGGQMTLIIAFVAVFIQIFIGLIIGVISGYYGGVIDNILSRFGEIVSSFPFYPLIITLASLLPADTSQYKKLVMIMVILGLLNWPGIARLVRGEILSEREKDYITAAKALGLKEVKIMLSHIVPNIISIIIVQATIGYAVNLLTESALSFLGFGVQNPYPSWGNMITAGSDLQVLEKFWWRWIFPGLAVFVTALTVNLMGDALRDAMDPKAQER